MKVKVAYGNFENSTRGPVQSLQTVNDPTGDSSLKTIHAITNRCHVRGVYFFNTDSGEKDVRLYDNDNTSLTYVAIQATPLVYQTIVPRDQTISRTWGIGAFSATVSIDLYDTPSGIYDTFPKPGFLFENGVSINCASAGTTAVDPITKLHYLIFYTE